MRQLINQLFTHVSSSKLKIQYIYIQSGPSFPRDVIDEKQPKQTRASREKLGPVIWRHENFAG